MVDTVDRKEINTGGLTVEVLRRFEEERRRGPNEHMIALRREYNAIKAAQARQSDEDATDRRTAPD